MLDGNFDSLMDRSVRLGCSKASFAASSSKKKKKGGWTTPSFQMPALGSLFAHSGGGKAYAFPPEPKRRSKTDSDSGAYESSEQRHRYGGGGGSDLLLDLTSLQKASGEFHWGPAAERALGMTRDEASGKVPRESEVDWECWLTVLVVVYLEERMAGDKELWELVAEKASRFIRARAGKQEDAIRKRALEIITGL